MAESSLIRIVRMHFNEAGVEEFLSLFEANREAIRNFPGCSHLQLFQDADDPLCFSTLSHWDSPESLESYRRSGVFEKVWGQAKSLFSERSQAFSLTTQFDLP